MNRRRLWGYSHLLGGYAGGQAQYGLVDKIPFGAVTTGSLWRMRRAYRMFRDKQDSCIEIVLKPWADVPTVEAAKVEESGRTLQ